MISSNNRISASSAAQAIKESIPFYCDAHDCEIAMTQSHVIASVLASRFGLTGAERNEFLTLAGVHNVGLHRDNNAI
jgi:hypothetical protein